MLLLIAEQSFRRAKWLPQARILELKPQLLRNFIQRRHDGSIDEFGDLVNGIHPDSLLVERLTAQKSTLHGQLYLTKWRSLAYSESTWESEEALRNDKVGCLLDQKIIFWVFLKLLCDRVAQQLTTELDSALLCSNVSPWPQPLPFASPLGLSLPHHAPTAPNPSLPSSPMDYCMLAKQ